MKLKIIVSLISLVSLTTAYPAKDAKAAAGEVISKAITRITLGIDDLDTSIKTVNEPKVEAFLPLANKAMALTPILKQAQADIEGAGRISAFDLMGTARVAQAGVDVQMAMSKLVDDVVNKAPLIKQAGLAPVVLSQLNAQGDSAKGLMKAVLNSLPDGEKDLAESALSGMDDPLAKLKTALA